MDVKVRMLVSMAGPDVSHVPGDTLTVRQDVADAWKSAGIAEPVSGAVAASAQSPKQTSKAKAKTGSKGA